jgi:hypothetical protein
LEILLMDKHDTAVELLATTEQQRSVAAQQLQRRIAQCEQVKVKVEKVHLMLLGRTKNGIIMGKSKCPAMEVCENGWNYMG